jgi:predicted aspartyl protease
MMLIPDDQFFKTYDLSKKILKSYSDSNTSVETEIQAHGAWLPFPKDMPETGMLMWRSPSPGVSEHSSAGDYDPECHYGIASSGEEEEVEKELPKGDTDEEEANQVKKEVKEEAVVDSEKKTTERTATPNEALESNSVTLDVKAEPGNFVVTDHDPHDQCILQTTDDGVYMCVDPGATSTLLKVDDAEKLYAQGKLSCITPSSKLFRVANGAMMAASTQGELKVGDRTETAYIIESTSNQQLPVSLLGLPHLTGCHLNLGVEPKLDNISLSRARNGHLYINL